MTSAPQKTRHEAVFGIIQIFMLVILLLLGALLALPLHKISLAGNYLDEVICNLLPRTKFPWIDAAIWAVELAAYGLIAFRISRKNITITLTAVVLGVVTRVGISVLMALLMTSSLGGGFSDAFSQVDRGLWVYRLLAIITTLCIFGFAYRQLLITGFGFLAPEVAATTPQKPQQFAFATRSQPQGVHFEVRSSTQLAAAQRKRYAPPDGFMPVAPKDNVYGMASIPGSIILDSVPDAESLLKPTDDVHVRLAYIVPQLRQATVWLLWQQIFSRATNESTAADNDRPDAAFRDRWVRIPAKYYALQVPPEFYSATKIPPDWMKLPEVPQESQFLLDG